MTADFEEIAHAGGKIEFLKADGGIYVKISNSVKWKCAMFQVCVSYDGQLLGNIPIAGLGKPTPPYPKPSIPVWLISDREGLWGRTCPNEDCGTYFRTNCVGRTICPYCGYIDEGVAFTTQNQLRYIARLCNAYIDALNSDRDTTLDLNSVIDELPNNRPQWMYSEERQQTRFDCKPCRVAVDILGEYGGCPACGKRNYSEVFEAKLQNLEDQFTQADDTLTDRQEREVEWEKLLRCVSEFEAMANDIKSQLLRLPGIPRRKNALRNLTFLHIEKANELLLDWYGFEVLEGIGGDDRRFLNRMFNRRHLFTHRAGRVDQEYLNNTGDTSVKLNQLIRIKSKEIRRLIPLVRQAGNNLIVAFEGIV